MRKTLTVLTGGLASAPDPKKNEILKRKNFSEMERLALRIDESFQWFWEGKDRGVLWVFDAATGLWRGDGRTKLKNIYASVYGENQCDEKGKKPYYPKALAELESYFLSLQADQHQALPEPDPKFIPFQNGVFNLDTNEITKYSHEHYFTSKLPWDFNENATCEWFLKLFAEWVNNPQELIDILALCLYRGMPVQKFFFFLGSGANGKTMLIQILTRALGSENVATLPMNEFHERFAAITLQRKLANIVDELPPDTIRDSGLLKRLTGESQVQSDVKYGERVTFTSYATQIVAMNTLPPTDDTSPAFYRRIHLVDFPNKIPVEKRDLGLSQKLATETANYEGLILLAIRTLQKARANQWHLEGVRERQEDEVKIEYSTRSDTVGYLVETFCEDEEGERVPAAHLISCVNRMRRIQGLPPVPPRFVAQRVGALGFQAERVRVNGDYQLCWMNLRLDTERLNNWFSEHSNEAELAPSQEIRDFIESATRAELAVLRAVFGGFTLPSKIATIANVDEYMMRPVIRDLCAANLIAGDMNSVQPTTDRARRAMIETALKGV